MQFLRKNHIQGSAWGSVYAGGGLRGGCQDNEIIYYERGDKLTIRVYNIFFFNKMSPS